MNTNNVGWRDAGLRGFAAGVLLLTSASIQHHPLVSLAVGFLGVVLTGTALFRVCPLYTLLRFNTCSSEELSGS